jgi:ABC-2 type transport system ATP-binding protein
MEEYIAGKGTIIIASHEERELSVCTRMYIMEDGVLKELPKNTSMDEIFGRLVQQND